MAMSKMLLVCPVYCRMSEAFLASINRTAPSSPAENNKCCILGCQIILTTPTDWSKTSLSTCEGMSQKLIFPSNVPVTTTLKAESGQNDTASTEFSSSVQEALSQDKVVNN